MLPTCVIEGPKLTFDLPFATAVTSAFNAIAHAANPAPQHQNTNPRPLECTSLRERLQGAFDGALPQA